jgi:hypothetical protein
VNKCHLEILEWSTAFAFEFDLQQQHVDGSGQLLVLKQQKINYSYTNNLPTTH